MGLAIEDENTHPIFLRNRHRGYTDTSCDSDFSPWTTQKSSGPQNRPENASSPLTTQSKINPGQACHRRQKRLV